MIGKRLNGLINPKTMRAILRKKNTAQIPKGLPGRIIIALLLIGVFVIFIDLSEMDFLGEIFTPYFEKIRGWYSAGENVSVLKNQQAALWKNVRIVSEYLNENILFK